MATGRFVWHELMTAHFERARRFYQQLLGWRSREIDIGEQRYVTVHVGDQPAAGMVSVHEYEPVAPQWLAYVTVDDVEATAKRVQHEGGRLWLEPLVVPDAGRTAVIVDPQGAALALSETPNGRAELNAGPGAFVWNELNAADPEEAMAFYQAVFGWQREPTRDPDRWALKINNESLAGLTQAPLNTPSHWLPYLQVADLAAARHRTEELGGRVFMGVLQAQDVGKFSVIGDSEGATLALLQR